MDIKNKVVIITGASQGIGLSTARILASQGAKIVLAARSSERLQTIAAELPDSLVVPTDMRKPADIAELIKKTQLHFDRIDVLVNNAGQGMYGTVENIDIEKYREILELNVFGVLIAMQAVIPMMRQQGGGMIVNISSRVSKNYYPNLGAYASTKYALNALSLTARQELAKDHIIVSVMHPKMTATNFGDNAFGQHPDFTDAAALRARGMEIDTPEMVAESIVKLIASEEPEVEM